MTRMQKLIQKQADYMEEQFKKNRAAHMGTFANNDPYDWEHPQDDASVFLQVINDPEKGTFIKIDTFAKTGMYDEKIALHGTIYLDEEKIDTFASFFGALAGVGDY